MMYQTKKCEVSVNQMIIVFFKTAKKENGSKQKNLFNKA